MQKTFRVQKSFEQEFGASNTWHASLIFMKHVFVAQLIMYTELLGFPRSVMKL